MREIEVPCRTCSATGESTHEDRHAGTNMDTCRTCGGRGTIPARPGESRETSWPFAVPGARVSGPEIVRHKKTSGLYEVLYRDARVRAHRSLSDYDVVLIVRHGEAGETAACSSMFNAPAGASILFAAIVQSSAPLVHGAEVVVYRAIGGGPVWVRPTSEMDDGRFEPADAPEPLLDPILVEEAKAMIAMDCSCDRDCQVNHEGICNCRVTAIAVMLKGAQSYVSQTEAGQANELNVIIGKVAPGMEAEGRDAPAARGVARQPDGEAGAPKPSSSTPGEVERLVDALIKAARAYGWSMDQGSALDDARDAKLEALARTALLSHISTAGRGEGAGELAAQAYDLGFAASGDGWNGDYPDNAAETEGYARARAEGLARILNKSADATNPQDQE